jgi:HAD superfamily hydrolase (TIGR01509 family)
VSAIEGAPSVTFKAVIFDCDGVLIDSESIAHDVEIAALGSIGLTYDEDEFRAKYQGVAVKEWAEGLDADHVARFRAPLPSGFIQALSAEITRSILSQIRPIAGAVAAVKSVRSPKAVASSSPRHELIGKIAGLGLTDEFHPHIYAGDDVARGKPAPDLFLHTAKRMGIDPGSCLVNDDSAHGVAAAIAAGMTPWGFVGGPHCTPSQADRLHRAGAKTTFQHMDEIAAALAKLT